eukprot:UN13135
MKIVSPVIFHRITGDFRKSPVILKITGDKFIILQFENHR